MTSELPEAIRRYMELASAPSASDADAIAACFTDDGEVKDEGETRRGHAAIRQWWEGPANAFEYTVEVQSIEGQADDRYVVLTRLTGTFLKTAIKLYKKTSKPLTSKLY